MRYLLDTNILLSLSELTRADHAEVRACIETLWGLGDVLCYTSQAIGEFWNVCTRPVLARGGLGLTIDETDRRVRLIESRFKLLEDSLETHLEWRRLIAGFSVMGVQIHDARLVAAMLVHGVKHLITNNTKDFTRYAGMITAISVQQLARTLGQPPLS